MTYEVSRSGPQTWNIALNREHWREQGKEKRSASGFFHRYLVNWLWCTPSVQCSRRASEPLRFHSSVLCLHLAGLPTPWSRLSFKPQVKMAMI